MLFALGELIVAYYFSELSVEVIAILLLRSILLFTYHLLNQSKVDDVCVYMYLDSWKWLFETV